MFFQGFIVVAAGIVLILAFAWAVGEIAARFGFYE